MMDNESWYSVTPEEIAKYTAKLIKGKTIIDGFCGCGGNVIQFSKYCSKVFAIDISKKKLDLCRNNCKVYNCKDNIEFIHSDFLEMKNKIKADYIFLSPPWGGTEYKGSEIYSIKKNMYPDITEIVRVSMNVADNILFFLPRNLDLDELFDICAKVKNEIKENSGKNIFFDIQIIKSNNRIKSLLIIFGHHIKDYFNKQKLEKFLNTQNYKNINENGINYLYDEIKKIGCYLFFKEEYNFRTKNINKNNIVDLCEYIKNFSKKN
jgi:16S rRNA G966 N2-methylase RsmD